jgi:hypothetical protein
MGQMVDQKPDRVHRIAQLESKLDQPVEFLTEPLPALLKDFPEIAVRRKVHYSAWHQTNGKSWRSV